MEELTKELNLKYLNEGLNEEVLKMSRSLDILIVSEQRKRLEEHKRSKGCINE